MTTYTPPMRRVDRTSWGRRTHYYVDAAGQRIPGVTTIIGDGIPKPGLIKWGMNATAAYAVDHWDDLAEMAVSDRLKTLEGAAYSQRDAAGNRGTEVHALGERLLHGQPVEVPEELVGHCESYVKFLDLYEPQVVISESPVVSWQHGYAGTIDMVVQMNGQTLLADIKTSRSGVFGEAAVQMAAYRNADEYLDQDGAAHPMPSVDGCCVIWVRGDGYDVIPVDAGDVAFAAFLRAKETAEVDLRDLVLPALEPVEAGLW